MIPFDIMPDQPEFGKSHGKAKSLQFSPRSSPLGSHLGRWRSFVVGHRCLVSQSISRVLFAPVDRVYESSHLFGGGSTLNHQVLAQVDPVSLVRLAGFGGAFIGRKYFGYGALHLCLCSHFELHHPHSHSKTSAAYCCSTCASHS